MLVILVRTLILYIFVVIALRIMGKRQIGQLQPFELVVTLMLSELAAIPMESPGIPLINGITPILTLIAAQVILSYISLKSDRARAVICGTPSVLIENGKIVESELKRLRYNLSDLLEQLRAKDVPNISDVEFAILETSGQLSVIEKSQKRPVMPEDLNLSTKYEGLPFTLIMDGQVLHKNLKKINLNIEWLYQQLANLGIENPSDVLFACLDTEGKLFYQLKSGKGAKPSKK
ncbi:YetF domain-containing protein [Phosphitispora sp. TUW77]|uniref:YetF domain-containing protein n=1 Tax=Phosphitispora sp. TUW77 TaxID=3152361 RepID=UPI003AB71FF8